MNERRKGRGVDGERRSFQHLAKGDDPLGDDAFVATVKALALEFKAASLSGKKIMLGNSHLLVLLDVN